MPQSLFACTVTRCAPILFICSVSALCAEPLPDAWNCLPAETVVAARIPQGAAVAEALRSGTKLGRVLFDPQRIERIGGWIRDQQGSLGEATKKLSEYGMQPEDFPQLLAGETGGALLLDDTQVPPVPVGLAWLNPGEELSGRLVTALERALEDQSNRPHPITRLDIQVEGRAVMQLSIPHISVQFQQAFSLPDNYNEMSEEEQKAAMEQAMEAHDESKTEAVSHSTLLFTYFDGRIAVAAELEPHREQDEAHVSRLTGFLARFLQGHQGASGPFVERVISQDGCQVIAQQAGLPILEILGDIGPLMKLARDHAPAEGQKVFEVLGLDQLGAMAMRMTLDDIHLRTGLFVAAPSPRSGIASLLDQPEVAAEPAAWIPAEIFEYGHVSVDLGEVYGKVKDWAMQIAGGQAGAAFQMGEMQFQQFLNTDPATVLSALGHQHTVVNFGAQLGANAAGDDEENAIEGVFEERMAIVWHLQDAELWGKILDKIGGFAPAQSAMKATDEQGFRGYRFINSVMEGGIVSGKGYLVLGLGEGTLEKTLSCLNHPPEGNAALAGSELYAKARTALSLQPGISLSVTDGNRQVQMLRDMLDTLLESHAMGATIAIDDDSDTEETDVQLPDPQAIEKIRDLFPSAAELQGVMGVSVSQVIMQSSGLHSESVTELPRAE